MDNNDEYNFELDSEILDSIMRECFGLGELRPTEMKVSYNDMVEYTKFITDTVLRAALKETKDLLEKQEKEIIKINYN